MKQPVLNLITSPDKLYNNNLSFTLVYPSTTTKEQFNEMAVKVAEDYTDELMQEMTNLQDKIDAQDLWEIDSKVDIAMQALRCPDEDCKISTLSGGQQNRLLLAKVLANPQTFPSCISYNLFHLQ